MKPIRYGEWNVQNRLSPTTNGHGDFERQKRRTQPHIQHKHPAYLWQKALKTANHWSICVLHEQIQGKFSIGACNFEQYFKQHLDVVKIMYDIVC